MIAPPRDRLAEIERTLDGMLDAYWRRSEASDGADAPSCVKAAIAAIADLIARSVNIFRKWLGSE